MSSFEQKCEIKTKTGELILNDATIVLRPKTFELLLLLANKPQHVFSKEEILSSVWQESVVEDQVIFQSINEIRKETGFPEIIKTYPRRGYSWELTNTTIDDATPFDNGVALASNSQRSRFSSLLPYALFGIIALLLLLFYINSHDSLTANNDAQVKHEPEYHTAEPEKLYGSMAHKGVLVLPFNVQALGGDQQWLRFGAMEGLINKLPSSPDTTVFRVEDVIEILNRLPLSERSKIERIFEKSGASHILETSISGQPGELNVIYTIYHHSSRTTRVFNANNIKTALSTLANIFKELHGKGTTVAERRFDSQLQNELMAKAMKFLEVDDLKSALTFVESAVLNQPDNIVARFFSAKLNLELGNVEQSLIAANKALAIDDAGAEKQYKHRLYFLIGVANLSLNNWLEAEKNLLDAEAMSKQNKDWLYYAYTQSMLGKLRQHQKRYDDAYRRFNAALEYQELLQCPFGVAQGHLDIAEFHLSNSNREQAQLSFNIAQSMVEEKQLNQVRPLLNHVEQKF